IAADSAGAMELAGLVAFTDPPRTAAAAVVRRCREAGIRVILVTGDHTLTARSIAAAVGIPSEPAQVLDGGAGGLRAADRLDASVFARVRPEQKLEIVEGLQARGEVVAMLGDGVNDAPALKQADIGVAAGLGGTEVARQAADLVLLDDDLSTVAAAVEEGRRIVANLRAFLVYAVSGGLSEVGVMLAGPFVGMPLPLLPSQILWINLLTHGLTGVAFTGEPIDPAQMRRPPLSRTAAVLQGREVWMLGIATASLTVSALWAGSLAADGHQRTVAFLALGLGQLGVALALRHRVAGRRSGLTWAVVASAGLMVAPVAFAPLQDLLRTTSLSLGEFVIAMSAATVPALLVALTRRISMRTTRAGVTSPFRRRRARSSR
ncbi:MAG: HAD-IC family P-type ATPase, partial [Nocardioides sp.]